MAHRRKRLAAQQPTAGIDDGESDARRRLVGEHALHTGAARRVAGIAIQRLRRRSQRRHVADQFEAKRAGPADRRRKQARACLVVEDARGLQGGERGDDRERQQRQAQRQE